MKQLTFGGIDGGQTYTKYGNLPIRLGLLVIIKDIGKCVRSVNLLVPLCPRKRFGSTNIKLTSLTMPIDIDIPILKIVLYYIDILICACFLSVFDLLGTRCDTCINKPEKQTIVHDNCILIFVTT